MIHRSLSRTFPGRSRTTTALSVSLFSNGVKKANNLSSLEQTNKSAADLRAPDVLSKDGYIPIRSFTPQHL